MRLIAFLFPAFLLLASCGGDGSSIPLAGSGGIDTSRAALLYSKGQEAEAAGKKKKAIKYYDDLADEIPLAKEAPDARFRQAQLLQEQGDTPKSFAAYQDILTRYQGSGLYQKALKQQSDMAFGVADGNIQNSFLGIKSNYSSTKVIEMLQKVAGNAPRSELAAKAEFKIAQLYADEQTATKVAQAVRAYRRVVVEYPDSPLAPEAQFSIGELLLEQAKSGNQDQANNQRARDAFQDYLDQFPGHSRNAEARKLMASLGNDNIRRSFEIAEFYEKKGEISSAKFYYEEVVRKAKTGETHDLAQARLNALGGN